MLQIRGINAIKNISYMYIAQFVQLALSLMMSIYVPIVISLNEFSYWQNFIFYSSYVGLLHLGLNDGIYLKYGGVNIDDNEKKLISSQLWISIIFQSLILILFLIVITSAGLSKERIYVFEAVVIYAIVSNIYNYCGSTLLTLNKIKLYSTTVVIDKLFVIISILTCIYFELRYFQFLIFSYISGRFIGMIMLLVRNKDIFLRKININKDVFREINQNIVSGSSLMLANIASTLIIGVGRLFIDINYSINVFGIVSFALTMTGFIMLLLSQVGIAVFPVLKTQKVETLSSIYSSLNKVISFAIPFTILVYPLLHFFITNYLPQYELSLKYFTYLLPMCFFEAKTSMLYNTYMKIFRMEGKLLYINIVCMSVSLLFSIISIYLFDSLNMLMLCLSFSVMLKSILLHYLLCKEMKIGFEKNILFFEIAVTLYCILILNLSYDNILKFFIIFMSCMVYGFFIYKKLKVELINIFVKK